MQAMNSMYDPFSNPHQGGLSHQVGFGMDIGKQHPQKASGIRFLRMRGSDAVGLQAAALVAEQLVKKPDSTIIFPTGNTPLPMYRALRYMTTLNWASSRLFHLDEYVPPANHVGAIPYETYAEYMRRELWDYIGGRKHFFAHYDDPAAYEREIAAQGKPDLVILGIGANGHIAFNEPGSAPDSPARTIDLADQTIVSNFGSVGRRGYPVQAKTLGLKTILSARKIILLATGETKRDILRRAFDPETPPTPEIPASWLKQHPDVTIITDFEL